MTLSTAPKWGGVIVAKRWWSPELPVTRGKRPPHPVLGRAVGWGCGGRSSSDPASDPEGKVRTEGGTEDNQP